MPEPENQDPNGDMDWDALADVLFGENPGDSGDDENKDGEGGDDPEGDKPEGDPEASKGDPTQPVLTQEAVDQLVNARIAELTKLAQQQKSAAEIARILKEGSDEEIAKLARERLAEAEHQQAIASAGNEMADAYAQSIVEAILTPEFVESLTPEERDRVNPDKFADDASFYVELVNLKAEKKTSSWRESDEFKNAVEEAVQAKLNEKKGQMFRQPSPSSIPSSTGGDDPLAGLTGESRADKLWELAMAEHTDRHPDF